jgi:hypothetical protein
MLGQGRDKEFEEIIEKKFNELTHTEKHTVTAGKLIKTVFVLQ